MKRRLVLYLKLFSFLFIFYSCSKTHRFEILYKFPFSSQKNAFFLRINRIKLTSLRLFENRRIQELYIVKFDKGELKDYLALKGKEDFFEEADEFDISYNEKFLLIARKESFYIFTLPDMNLIKEIPGYYPRFYKDSLVTYTWNGFINIYDFIKGDINTLDKGGYPVIRNDKLFYFKSGKVFTIDLKTGLKDSIILNKAPVNPDVSFDGSKLCFIYDFRLMVYDISAGTLDTFKMNIEYGGYFPFITPPPYPRWTSDNKIIMRNKGVMYLFIPETLEIVEIARNYEGY